MATVIDCYSKSILEWSVDEHYDAELVCTAMTMAAHRIDCPPDRCSAINGPHRDLF
ncbi:hypothetical protein [Amycolatopsis thermalba]|uniref:hypothetical protein n=1 Tax=Amycolatopsis thermalba TaxID=944492 RepID=UPI003B848858